MKELHILSTYKRIIFTLLFIGMSLQPIFAQYQMENLDRGLVAVQTGNGVFLSWRVLGTDPKSISFNIYRNGTKINATPITGATNMVDAAGSTGSTYTVRPIIGGTEQAARGSATVWGSQVRTITLSNRPSNNHAPNDINVGDLDGDGQYELVVKWYPSNAKDNSQSGVTDNTYLAAYKMDGSFLWIIDLGRNIRSGAHYTQHLVGDYDSDGFAEVACKTAPGTRDGVGTYLSSGPAASDNDATSYANTGGYILTGPEYLTIFNGRTGKEMATVNYPVARGNVGSWGDTYGNRVDRFNSTNAYLNGVKPSMIFQRGYYTRLTAAAMDWDGRTLSTRWIFDSNNSGSTAAYGQGNHSIMAADIDGDGFDEVLTGSACIDHDGRLKWTTGFGHGDANHVGDFDPNSPGLEVWQVSENKGSEPDHYMVRASDGRVLWRNGSGNDNGRGMIADIDARYPGQEAWSNSVAGTYQANGTQFTTSKPSSANFRVYWDGDLQDELPNGSSNNTNNRIDKWNGNGTSSIFTLTGLTCNGTKATPNIVADLLGDWREEIILHDGANRLYIHTTTTTTQHKMYTLMHDPAYRNAISYQQSSYNQPPHLGFWLGAGIDKIPTPNIVLVGQTPSNQLPTTTITAPVNNATYVAPAAITINATAADTDGTISKVDFYNGTTLIGTDATAPYSFNWTNVPAGTYSITTRATDNLGATGTSSVITVVVQPAPGFTLQAELACTANGILNESTNAGFTGSGYLNLDNVAGSAASWVVNSTAIQTATIAIRYANGGTTSRNMSLQVNGTTQVASIAFPTTAAWTTWQTTTVSVNLVAGRNTFILTSLTADGAPNLDQFAFNTFSITTTSCLTPIVAVINPAGPTTFCAGENVVLNANSETGLTYKWLNNNIPVTGATSASYTATIAGSYKVIVSLATNTDTSEATVVVLHTNPIATITSTSTNFCQGSTLLLNATAGNGFVYKWFNGTTQVGTNSTYTANTPGAYTVEVTNASGCKATSAPTVITVGTAQATPTISSSSTSFCPGGSIVLTSSSGTSYKWFNGTTQVGTAATHTATTAGAYTVEVTNASGCKAISAPTVITVGTAQATPTISSSSTSFCPGGSVVLTSSSGTSYKWFNGTTQVGTAATHTATTAGSYTVEVTNTSGCKAISVPTVITVGTAQATPTISSSSTSFCPGSSVVLTSSSGTSYKWFNGTTQVGTAATHTATTAGAYTVEVTNASGCKATSAPTVITVGTAQATPTISSSSTSFCPGSSVVLTSSSGTSYKWFNGTTQVGTAATHTATTAGSYTVEVTNGSGCKATSDVTQITITATVTWYADTDNDGMGDISNTVTACTKPNGYVATSGDACPADANKTDAGNCGCGNTESSCLDCAGTPNGTAFFDNCSFCVEGTTGNKACVSTSTTNGTSANIKVVPQPFDNSTAITVENHGAIQSFTIISASGALVETRQGLNKTEIIIGESIASGLYTVIITTEQGTYITKIVKK
jgi:hypothetical protein